MHRPLHATSVVGMMQSSNGATDQTANGTGPAGNTARAEQIANVDNRMPSDREPGEPAAAKALGAPQI